MNDYRTSNRSTNELNGSKIVFEDDSKRMSLSPRIMENTTFRNQQFDRLSNMTRVRNQKKYEMERRYEQVRESLDRTSSQRDYKHGSVKSGKSLSQEYIEKTSGKASKN